MKTLEQLGISPAPWSVKQGSSIWVEDSQGDCICDELEWRETKAIPNARLIAAAPELYEALRELWDEIELTDWNNKDYWPFTKKAEAALAKAGGESEVAIGEADHRFLNLLNKHGIQSA